MLGKTDLAIALVSFSNKLFPKKNEYANTQNYACANKSSSVSLDWWPSYFHWKRTI